MSDDLQRPVNNKPLNQFDTLSEATTDLNRRGYRNFEVIDGKITDVDAKKSYEPEELTVCEYHRFEGTSAPDDMSVLYGVETKEGTRGMIVDGYGTYSDNDLGKLVKRMKMKEGLS